MVLNQFATAYLEGLTEFKETVEDLVAEINTANGDWDNRSETGVSFSETASALVDIRERTQALATAVRDHQVPSVLVDIHSGPDGPVGRAAELATLAEAVLAGLRLPAPEDGSQRRAALDDFNSVAEAFNATADSVIQHAVDNAKVLGLTTGSVSPTTAVGLDVSHCRKRHRDTSTA